MLAYPLPDGLLGVVVAQRFEPDKPLFAQRLSETMPITEDYISQVYSVVADEEVGGTVTIFYRDTDGTIATRQKPVTEPPLLRRAYVATHVHAIIFANGGEFQGKVKAEDFLLPSGDSMVSILNQDGKIKGDYIDAKGINIKDPSTGETILSMDSTGIHWATQYSPIKYQYSTSATGPWRDTRSANDEYRRESTDGGTTWSEGIKFVAKDGRNGSDASVTFDNMLKALQKAENTKTSFMTADEMGAPTIYGAKIYGAEIYAGGVGEKGGQIIGLTDSGIKVFNGVGNAVLTIHENNGGATLETDFSFLELHSPYINIGQKGETIFFRGNLADFTGVKEVTGIHYTLA